MYDLLDSDIKAIEYSFHELEYRLAIKALGKVTPTKATLQECRITLNRMNDTRSKLGLPIGNDWLKHAEEKFKNNN